MVSGLDDQAAHRLSGKTEVTKKKFTRDDATIDAMAEAFHDEYQRWQYRYNDLPGRETRGSLWELVRDTSPKQDIISEEFMEIITFTKRECKDRTDAEAWLETYRSRAAINAALDVAEGKR